MEYNYEEEQVEKMESPEEFEEQIKKDIKNAYDYPDRGDSVWSSEIKVPKKDVKRVREVLKRHGIKFDFYTDNNIFDIEIRDPEESYDPDEGYRRDYRHLTNFMKAVRVIFDEFKFSKFSDLPDGWEFSVM